jgi:hypothetical protein
MAESHGYTGQNSACCLRCRLRLQRLQSRSAQAVRSRSVVLHGLHEASFLRSFSTYTMRAHSARGSVLDGKVVL